MDKKPSETAASPGERNKGGRPKGQPNKVTADVRAALAQIVEGSVGRLQESLDRVLYGVTTPVHDKDGQPVTAEGGEPLLRYIVAPDPARYVDLVTRLTEYCVPKLSRSELTGKDGNPIETRAMVDELVLAQLRELGDRVRAVGASIQPDSEPKRQALQ
jgi:hypothetical protein